MNAHNFPPVKRIRITYDVNRNRDGYLPDVRKIDAKNADIWMNTWTYESKTYFDLYIEWLDKSVRPLVKHSESVYSTDIIKMIIDN